MNDFWNNLKRQATENPIVAMGVGVAVLTAVGKLIEASGNARGSHAYARDVNRRVKRDSKR